jgi:hypothetical protein
MNDHTTYEALGVFAGRDELERAVRALEGAGVDRSQMSLLGTREAAGVGLGLALRPVEAPTAADEAAARRREDPGSAEGKADVAGLVSGVPAYVGGVLAAGAVAATGGALAGVAAAAAAGAAGGAAAGGGLAGALGNDRQEAVSYEDELRDGPFLLFVTLEDPGGANETKRVLEESGARRVRTEVVTEG